MQAHTDKQRQESSFPQQTKFPLFAMGFRALSGQLATGSKAKDKVHHILNIGDQISPAGFDDSDKLLFPPTPGPRNLLPVPCPLSSETEPVLMSYPLFD